MAGVGEEVYTNTQHLRLMLQAVDAVISGSMSQREAAKAFNIPRSTLRCHLPRHETYKHKLQKQPSNSRGKAVFSKKEEKELVEYVISMHRCGFGRTRKDFMLKLQETLDKAERKTKFENNMPTDEWFAAFLERHKDEIKECIIHYPTQEKGLIPADVLGVNQAVIEEVVHTVDHASPTSGGAVPIADLQPQHQLTEEVSHNTYHHLAIQQQQQHQLGAHTIQVQSYDPSTQQLLQQQHHHQLHQQQQQQPQQQQHSHLQAVLQQATMVGDQQQQQQQHQLQGANQLQQFVTRANPAAADSVARCRTLPFHFSI